MSACVFYSENNEVTKRRREEKKRKKIRVQNRIETDALLFEQSHREDRHPSRLLLLPLSCERNRMKGKKTPDTIDFYIKIYERRKNPVCYRKLLLSKVMY